VAAASGSRGRGTCGRGQQGRGAGLGKGKGDVAEPTWIIPAQVRESTLEGSNVLQTV
jgi:hypothetical protein